MRMIYKMKHYLAYVSVVLLAALVAASRVEAAENQVTADAAAPVAAESQPSQRGLKDDVPAQPLDGLPSQSAPATVFRDIPSISGRYSVRGRTVMPYLGAGFGGGYASDLNRSLGGSLPAPADSGLRSQFGQSFSPNEFQMGLRIPF